MTTAAAAPHRADEARLPDRLVAVLALAGTALTVFGALAGAPWHGTRVDPPRPPAPFVLPSAGWPVSLEDLKGPIVVLSLHLGFAYCPGVCPLTMPRLADAVRRLGRLAADVRVVAISVDPERDTAEKMNR